MNDIVQIIKTTNIMTTELTKKQATAMHKCVDKDDTIRPNFTGLWHQEGRISASDGHVLVTLEAGYNESLEGKILHKSGEVMDGRIPNIWSVIPREDRVQPIEVDIKELHEAAKNVLKCKKAIDGTGIVVGSGLYKADLLVRVLDVLQDFDVVAHNNPNAGKDDYNAIVFKTKDNKAIGLLMNIALYDNNIEYLNGDYREEYGKPKYFSIKDALNSTPFVNTRVIGLKGEVIRGVKIGEIEVKGLTYDVVEPDKYPFKAIFASHNGSVQTFSDKWGYTDFADLTEKVEALEELRVSEYLPKSPTRIVKACFPNDDVKIVEYRATRIRGKIVDGHEIEIVRYKGYFITFDGYIISGNYYSDDEYELQERYEKIDGMIDEAVAFVEKNF